MKLPQGRVGLGSAFLRWYHVKVSMSYNAGSMAVLINLILTTDFYYISSLTNYCFFVDDYTPYQCLKGMVSSDILTKGH